MHLLFTVCKIPFFNYMPFYLYYYKYILSTLLVLSSEGDVPPGGIEGLWISDLSLKDKVKDDSYLWMRSAISRVQCALECTADTRCLSHFYRETSATCIAQDTDLDSITVRNSSGYLAYGFLSSRMIFIPIFQPIYFKGSQIWKQLDISYKFDALAPRLYSNHCAIDKISYTMNYAKSPFFNTAKPLPPLTYIRTWGGG